MGVQLALLNTDVKHKGDLHLQHGPIDLIVSVSGSDTAIDKARELAQQRFDTILDELVSELPVLRQVVHAECNLKGEVAKRMWRAANRFAAVQFITPMASVAGAVADEVLAAMTTDVHDINRISVNNGGDIAIWLGDEQSCAVGVADPLSGQLMARANIQAGQGIAGVATSGRHGRSLSLGIADSVTVLADNAASADAAATLIANAVELTDNQKILKVPATEIDPDSDLGSRLVTTDVKLLTHAERFDALQSGLAVAENMKNRGFIKAAYLVLQGQCVATEHSDNLLHMNDIQHLRESV